MPALIIIIIFFFPFCNQNWARDNFPVSNIEVQRWETELHFYISFCVVVKQY